MYKKTIFDSYKNSKILLLFNKKKYAFLYIIIGSNMSLISLILIKRTTATKNFFLVQICEHY